MYAVIKDALSVFSPGDRIKLLLSIFFLVLTSFVEVIGLALLAILAGLLLGQNLEKLLEPIDNLINISITTESFLVIVVLFFLAKLTLFALVQFSVLKFVYKNYSFTVQKLMGSYIGRSYIEFIKNNISTYHRNINNDAFWTFAHVVIPMFNIITEAFILSTLSLIFISSYDYDIDFIWLLIFPVFVIFFKIYRNFFHKKGKVSQFRIGEINRITREMLNSIKFLKTANLHAFARKIITDSVLIYGNNSALVKVLAQMPKHVFEFLIVVLIVYYLIGDNINSGYSTSLGFALVAILRAIPSINRIMSEYTMLSYYLPSLVVIKNELNNKNYHFDNLKTSLTIDSIQSLEINNLSFSYGANDFSFNNFSYTFYPGNLYLIKGESGSGKTTFLNLICGLMKPSRGYIGINNKPFDLSSNDLSMFLSYVPQEVFITAGTIRSNIVFGRKLDSDSEKYIEDAIYVSGLEQIVHKRGLDAKVSELGALFSGGERQRLSIARAIFSRPKILIMDEATSAVDLQTKNLIIRRLREKFIDMIIILVSHDVELEKEADFVLDFSNKSTFSSLDL